MAKTKIIPISKKVFDFKYENTFRIDTRNPIKVGYAVLVHRLHRYVFDNIYVYGSGKTTKKQKVIIKTLNVLICFLPAWRKWLPYTKKYQRYTR